MATRDALRAAGIKVTDAYLGMRPKTKVSSGRRRIERCAWSFSTHLKNTKTCSAFSPTSSSAMRRSNRLRLRDDYRSRRVPQAAAAARVARIRPARLGFSDRARAVRRDHRMVRAIDSRFRGAQRHDADGSDFRRADARGCDDGSVPVRFAHAGRRASNQRPLSQRRRHGTRAGSGTRVREGRQVSLVVSNGVQIYLMPDMRYQTMREAGLDLSHLHLQLGKVKYVQSDEVPANHIVDQDPAPLTSVREGARSQSDGFQGRRRPNPRSELRERRHRSSARRRANARTSISAKSCGCRSGRAGRRTDESCGKLPAPAARSIRSIPSRLRLARVRTNRDTSCAKCI